MFTQTFWTLLNCRALQLRKFSRKKTLENLYIPSPLQKTKFNPPSPLCNSIWLHISMVRGPGQVLYPRVHNIVQNLPTPTQLNFTSPKATSPPIKDLLAHLRIVSRVPYSDENGNFGKGIEILHCLKELWTAEQTSDSKGYVFCIWKSFFSILTPFDLYLCIIL